MGMTKPLDKAMRAVHHFAIFVIPIRCMRRLDVSFGPTAAMSGSCYV